MSKHIAFNNQDHPEFYATLQKKVRAYFNEVNDKPRANAKFWGKALVMTAIYWVPLFAILFISMPTWLFFVCWVIIGMGMAGIGMNVMHDANHGSVSEKGWINKTLGASIYLLSGNVFTWKTQHNVLHHSYTNVYGADEDLDARGLLRLHPEEAYRPLHKYQHWYATFLYGLLTLNWLLTKDFTQLFRYHKLGVAGNNNKTRELINIIFWKIAYFAIFIGLPIFVGGYSFGMVILGVVLAHFLAGIVLSIVFQLAHVMPDVSHPVEKDEKTEYSWAVLQLRTTANFSTKSRFVTWFAGGLNFQIEHHLFPNISHIHYPNIAKIVRQTAEEMKLPYYEYRTFWQATVAHFRYLKELAKGQTATA